jgi:hypothetical protein
MDAQRVAPNLLRKGLVVSVREWEVPGKKRVLELPRVGYEVRITTAQVREMPVAQYRAFATEFKTRFTSEFGFLRRKWGTDLRRIVRDAEEEIIPLGRGTDDTPQAVEQMRVIVDRTNAELRARCAAMTGILKQTTEEIYRAALVQSCKAVKTKPQKPAVTVTAEFELIGLLPPAVPNVLVSRFVTMPTVRLPVR